MEVYDLSYFLFRKKECHVNCILYVLEELEQDKLGDFECRPGLSVVLL